MSSKPQRWTFPASHLQLLKVAMGDGVKTTTVTPEQRSALRQICSAPERMSLAPEDFLIAFKLALVDAANELGIKPGPERNELLARLVTAYIEEFYRSPGSGDALSARDRSRKTGDQELAAGGP